MSDGCRCTLCRARNLSRELGRSVHPWELYYGIDSPGALYVRKYRDEPIWFYDQMERAHEYHGREVTVEEAQALMPSEYERWSKAATS